MIPVAFPQTSIPNPALEGLTQVGMTGREIAGMADVTAPTISKWRQGKVRTPAATMVFLTLVLAHKVEEYETWERDHRRRFGGPVSDWLHGILSQLDAARACLRAQEICNAAFSPESIHEGARRYRDWLNDTGGMTYMAAPHFDASYDAGYDGGYDLDDTAAAPA